MEDFQRSTKKKSRFSKATSDHRMKEIAKGYVPKNTQKHCMGSECILGVAGGKKYR